jgi:Tfp pilus assembly protein PilF
MIALPSQGGPAWREHKSEHFTLRTDLPVDEGKGLASQLEEVHALLNTVIANGKAGDVKCTVVVFRSRSEFLPFVPSQDVYGLFFPRSPIDLDPEPTFLTSEKLDLQNRVILTHELTHRFLARILGPMPMWLNEGLAEYYSTAHAENGKAIVGEPNLLRGFTTFPVPFALDLGTHKRVFLPLRMATPPSTLMTLNPLDFRVTEEDVGGNKLVASVVNESRYLSSWAFVHMLLNGPPEYAERFGKALEGATERDVGDTFSEAFAGVPLQKIDRDFAKYLTSEGKQHFRTDFRPPAAGRVDTRELLDTDIAITLARLSGGKNETGKWLEQALAIEPSSPRVVLLMARYRHLTGQYAESRKAYEKLLRGSPDDADALYGYGALLADDDAGWAPNVRTTDLPSVVARLAKVARSYSQLNFLASEWVTAGRAKSALDVGRKACELEPNCWECFATYARALDAVGAHAQAAHYQAMAMTRIPEKGISLKAAKAAVEALLKYRRAAASPARCCAARNE